jgi:hypothetical protein
VPSFSSSLTWSLDWEYRQPAIASRFITHHWLLRSLRRVLQRASKSVVHVREELPLPDRSRVVGIVVSTLTTSPTHHRKCGNQDSGSFRFGSFPQRMHWLLQSVKHVPRGPLLCLLYVLSCHFLDTVGCFYRRSTMFEVKVEQDIFLSNTWISLLMPCVLLNPTNSSPSPQYSTQIQQWIDVRSEDLFIIGNAQVRYTYIFWALQEKACGGPKKGAMVRSLIDVPRCERLFSTFLA